MFMQSREAVRVKVKKHEGKNPPELQKFSVDPQITSLEVLQSILIKAFNLKGDFSLAYRATDHGQEDYTALLSDWDLDAAFLRAQNTSNIHGTEPCVHLRVDVKQLSENCREFESNDHIPVSRKSSYKVAREGSSNPPHSSQDIEQKQTQSGLQGLFFNQVERTLSMVSRALNFSEDPNTPLRPALSDVEFRSFLDPVGQVIHGSKLREVVYCGGIDPSLRRVVWKHILNVYPDGMSGIQRMDYMKRKSSEYFMLRDVWRDCIQKGQVSGDLAYVTSMVKKDVLRTDRHHKFYAGSDDNQNIASLFNILTTYALNHPLVSYCQGMSDLASPLLVTMGDEAHAYICLCALMTRLHPNFLLDGEAMTLKFTHLTESLQIYDPQFYSYLKNQQADDLLFCYRWLLLEMKREFAFEDSLRMLEVLWSSLPPAPPQKELSLQEKMFCPNNENQNDTPISPLVKTPRENAYTKLCAMRRQNSSNSLAAAAKTKIKTYNRLNQSLDENIGKKNSSPVALQFSKDFQSMDDTINHSAFQPLSNYHSDIVTKVASKRISESSCSMSTSSSVEQEHEDLICDDSEQFENNDHLTETCEAQNKISPLRCSENSLLNKQKHCTQDENNPPIKLIENFNEFNNLTLYHRRIKSASQPSNEKNNSIQDLKILNMQLKKCIVKRDVHDHVDTTLKESECEDSSPDDSKDYSPMTTSITQELKLDSENFDRVLCCQCMKDGTSHLNVAKLIPEESDYKCSNCEYYADDKPTEDTNNYMNNKPDGKNENTHVHAIDQNYEDIFVWENPLHNQAPGVNVSKSSEISQKDFSVLLKQQLTKNEDVMLDGSIVSPQYSSTRCNETNNEVLEKPKSISRENSKVNSKFFSNMSQELENARKNCEVLLSNKKSSNLNSIAATITNFQKKYDIHPSASVSHENTAIRYHNVASSFVEDSGDTNDIKNLPSVLPPPHTFGGGNPFLMFLCLTLLMQHRDHIMRNHMDYNELAMHFDKMVRKHNVNRVLNQARRMYSQYLKHQNENIEGK